MDTLTLTMLQSARLTGGMSLSPLKSLLGTAVLLSSVAISEVASAQWVSSTGSDQSDCSRISPCKTLQHAVDTYPDSIIQCLDSGQYGTLDLTTSATIDCTSVKAWITGHTFGVFIHAPNVNVVLRGLNIVSSVPVEGGAGVYFAGSGSLTIEDSVIGSQTMEENGRGYGVWFRPNATSNLTINNTSIFGNGFNATGGGVQIAPTGGSATVVINDAELSRNTVGIRADSSQTSGLVQVAISNTVSANNRYHGFVALGSGGPLNMALTDVVASGNVDNGVRAAGANAIISIGDSLVSGNGIGLNAVLGGTIESFGTNQIRRNISNGVTPEVIDLR